MLTPLGYPVYKPTISYCANKLLKTAYQPRPLRYSRLMVMASMGVLPMD